MTPEERSQYNVSLNREWNTDEKIRKQIAKEIREAMREAYKNAAQIAENRAHGSQEEVDAANDIRNTILFRIAQLDK